MKKKDELKLKVNLLKKQFSKIDFSNKKIGVISYKGGVGKSTTSLQLALALNLKIIEADAYGILSGIVDEEIIDAYEEGEEVILPSKGGYVVDFGAYAHPNEDRIIEELDILIVPFSADELVVGTTYNMIDGLNLENVPVLFVANRVKPKDEELVISAFKLFDSLVNGSNLGFITTSDALPTATNGNYSVIKKVIGGKGLEPSQNITVAMQFLKLFNDIENTIKGEVLDAR